MKEGQEQQDPRTYAIIGAAIEVHRELGCGFLEAVYHEALALELEAKEIPARREVSVPIYYRGHKLAIEYRVDFICFESVVVELKALLRITGVEDAQVLNYLKATGHEVGLLLNFGLPSLDWKRYIRTTPGRLSTKGPLSAESVKSADRIE